MQAKNKQKNLDEIKRKESKQLKRQLLKERVIGDCREVLQKRDTGEGQDIVYRARTLTLPDRGIFKSAGDTDPIQTRGDLPDDDASLTDEEEEVKNLPNPTHDVKHKIRFKRLGSKTASNMKELKNGIGMEKLVGYNEKVELFKKPRLPSMGQPHGTAPTLVLKRPKRESNTPTNLGNNRQLLKPRNDSKTRKLVPMFTRAASEAPKEERTTVASSIIQKNIEQIGQMGKNYSHITDVNVWLKKKGLNPNTKVYIVSPAYPDIKAALDHRGWIENPDYDSNCFHLKFSLKGRDIGYDLLQGYQVVNHFEKATTITTKSGLSKSVKNMVWCCHEDSDSFFPKCFDTVDDAEYEAFQSYYKVLKAESVLKEYLQKSEADKEQMVQTRRSQIEAAIAVTSKRLVDLDEMIDAPGTWTEVTAAEWEMLAVDEKGLEREREASMDFGDAAGKGKKIMERRDKSVKKSVDVSQKFRISRSLELNASPKKTAFIPEKIEMDLNDIPQTTKFVQDLIDKIAEKSPQTSINGQRNIWIVKPAGLSRGRGIRLFNSMAEIHNYSRGKDNNWVIQKYIEHPLLYKNRKLDIRQWVMVTDWNPLTVWFYRECYVRLSFSDYDLEDIADRFRHLTNNSINKHAKNFEKEDGFLSQDDFADYLKSLAYPGLEDPFYTKIQPKMQEIVKNTLMCVQDMVENRKNSSEIYGYDFCVDDQLNPWLIEINASPAWDYSSVRMYLTSDSDRETDKASQRRLRQSDGRLQHCQQKAKASCRHGSLHEHLRRQGTIR